jgi:hypothetical protein
MANDLTTGTLNIKLDMEKVNQLLDLHPRLNVTTMVRGSEQTITEIIRTTRPGTVAADNQVNVLC